MKESDRIDQMLQETQNCTVLDFASMSRKGSRAWTKVLIVETKPPDGVTERKHAEDTGKEVARFKGAGDAHLYAYTLARRPMAKHHHAVVIIK